MKLFAHLDLTTFPEQDSHFLATVMDAVDQEIARLQTIRGHAEMALDRRMRDADATALPDPEFTIQRRYRTPIYDDSILCELRERLSPEDLTGVYTPEHEETVTIQAKWDGRRLPGLKRFGGEIADIIDAGTVRPFAGVEVKRKERKS